MEEMNNGLMTVVLQIDMQCECKGCHKKMERIMNSLKKYEGVERIRKDLNSGTVTIVGTMGARELRQRLSSKTKKTVTVVFPTELPPPATQPHVGNPSQVMPLDRSFDHRHALPSAPPIGEMPNSIVAVQPNNEVLRLRENGIRDVERIRQLEEKLEAQNIELEKCRRMIREIVFGTT
ncbi:uncharacterized protein [Typha angustifolia]|uniref:uncharacterized protein n=1 Tax=Typha angustifolia TaxID=59011 RepID=UPI003C305055